MDITSLLDLLVSLASPEHAQEADNARREVLAEFAQQRAQLEAAEQDAARLAAVITDYLDGFSHATLVRDGKEALEAHEERVGKSNALNL